VHKFLNVKLNGHTPPCLYSIQNRNEKKQYGISFEVATSLQIKLYFQNFLHALLS